jgi:L-alanine-DL-glutamate epimerase-like enolase superfamily enzyme
MSRQVYQITAVRLYFIPVETRVPLKFGPETLTSVTCARVALTLSDKDGNRAEGWGETPLSVQWVWPGSAPYEQRHNALKQFCQQLANAWMDFTAAGDPITIGYDFQREVLAPLQAAASSALPWLAALVCNSPFDIALHDAFGRLVGRPVYQTYSAAFMTGDLAMFLEPASDSPVRFRERYPSDWFAKPPASKLRAWHLVGGLDPIDPSELTGSEPRDGFPVILTDWIERDGLKCLKIKLRGNDCHWDYCRLVRVGEIALAKGVEWLSADFNCTVLDPPYVIDILDRLAADHRVIWERILYVEQPFPYELEKHRIDVHEVATRKPLFLDESAHDWKQIRLGRELGWTGVALKTCKTQTGAILSACWARAHGMSLMVQDLTNPMLAQIPHVLLAAHVGTIMGIETNAMQFYPAASGPEQAVHPGLFQRRDGVIDLSSIRGTGFGYRVDEIQRVLPEPATLLGS